MSFPAETVVRRYQKSPEQLAAELHEQAEHIKEECFLSFVDLRLAEQEARHDRT